MPRKMRQIGPFLGLMTSVDAPALPEGYAQDLQNVRIEDGKLRVRYGYANVAATGKTPVYGFSHCIGYNSSYAEVDEFVAFMNSGGNVRAYSVDPTTGVDTEIKNGVTSVNLNASDWVAVPFEDKAYFVNMNNSVPVYQHTIGDATSMVAVTAPAKPTTALTFRAKYSATSYTSYDVLSFAGLNPANGSHVSGTGIMSATAGGAAGANTGATPTSGVDKWMKFQFYYVGNGNGLDGSLTIDLNAATIGVRDWSYNDIFAFVLDCEQQDIEPGSIAVSFINNDGSPITIAASDIQAVKVSETGAPLRRQLWHVRAEFKAKVRADWDNIRYIVISFRVVAGEGYAYPYITLSQFTIGCVDCAHYPASPKDNLEFAYSYAYNSSGIESDRIGKFIGTQSYPVIVPNDILDGKPMAFQTEPLGAWIEFTTAASGDSGVDRVRLYCREQNGWHLVNSQDDATTTYLYRQTIDELRAIATALSSGSGFSNMKGAAAFKGWMVWLRAGGKQNVLHSRIGEPLRLASDTDETDDENCGATFSLADNFGDEPVYAGSAGDAIVILGKYGAYAQVGNKPSGMSPCRKVPGSFGIANQFAACRWRDADGNPGIAFVSKNLEGIYFVQVDQSFDGDQGFRLQELTTMIRPSIKAYCSASTVRLVSDDEQDALWVIDGGDAFVLRRPSLVDGQRQWERYVYYDLALSYLTFSPKYRKRGLSDAGKYIALETNASGTGYTYDGSAGNALPLGSYATQTYASYWQSKDFVGENRRVMHGRIHPALNTGVNGDSLWLSVEGVDRSDSALSAVEITDDAATDLNRTVRFGFKTQGWQFSYKVTLQNGSQGGFITSYLQRMEFEEMGPIGRRLLS